jgi:hypothetical protein
MYHTKMFICNDYLTRSQSWDAFISLIIVTVIFLTVSLVGMIIPLKPVDTYIYLFGIGLSLLIIVLVVLLFIAYDKCMDSLREPRPILEAV